MARIWLSLALGASALAMLLPCASPTALQAQTVAAPSKPLSYHVIEQSTGRGETTRVQADLARMIESWQGADGCDTPQRARQALRPVVTRWLEQQKAARPRQRIAAWGYHSGDVWSEYRVVDGKPQCSAGFRKLIAYANFR
jgi:hypothetical protein